MTLPDATRHSFWLNSCAWEYPDFENAEAFVAKLARRGIIARDPSVEMVVRGSGDRSRCGPISATSCAPPA